MEKCYYTGNCRALLIQQGIKPPYSDEVTEAGLAIFSHLGEPKPGKVGRPRRESGKLTRASGAMARMARCRGIWTKRILRLSAIGRMRSGAGGLYPSALCGLTVL